MEALKRFDVRFLGLNEGFGVCFVGWIEDFFDISCFLFWGLCNSESGWPMVVRIP